MAAAVLVGRVGGLAAALGAGVAISIALSAPASAEPTDSPAGTRSEADSGARSGVATRRAVDIGQPVRQNTRSILRAAGVATTPGPDSTRSRTARITRAGEISDPGQQPPIAPSADSTTTTTLQVSRSEVADTAPAPATSAVPMASASTTAAGVNPVDLQPVEDPVVLRTGLPGPTAGSVAQPIAGPTALLTVPADRVAAPSAAASTSLLDSLLSLLGCDPRGRLITIFKGTHFAIPNSFGYFTKRVSGTGTFTTDTVYDLKDEDQYDWNKFTGIAFTPLEPDRNSVMVGWRYNLASKEFEIAPFYNVDKKRILPDEQTEVISVPAGETFDYTVDYTGVRISYGGQTVYKPYPEGLKPNVWTASRVSGWFGGNETAPRTISYYLKIAR